MKRVKVALKILNRLNDREMFILGCALENLIILLKSRDERGNIRTDERPDNGWRTLENDTHVQFDLESGEIISGPGALVGAKFEKNEKGKTVAKKPDGSEVGWKGLKKGESGSNNGNESESNSKYKSKITFTDNFFENRNALDALAAGTVIKVNGQTYEKSEDNFTEWINTETGEIVYSIQIANSNYGAEVEVDKSKPEIAREKKEKEAQEKQKQIDDSYESSIDKSTKINPKHMNKNYTILSNASTGRELYFKQDGKAYKFVKDTNGWVDAVTGERVTSYAMTDRLQGLSRANWRTEVVAGEATDVYFGKPDVVGSSSSKSGRIFENYADGVKQIKGAAPGSVIQYAGLSYRKLDDGNWESRQSTHVSVLTDDEMWETATRNGGELKIVEDLKREYEDREDIAKLKASKMSVEKVRQRVTESVSKMDSEAGKDVERVMSNGSEDGLALMAIHVIADRGGDTVFSFDGTKPNGFHSNGCYVSGSNDGVIVIDAGHIAKNRDGRTVGEVYVHESGHLIDNAMGRRRTGKDDEYLSSQDVQFSNALDQDYKDAINRIKAETGVTTAKEAQGALSREITVSRGEETRVMGGVQDIMEGCSKGKVRGTYGHGSAYYKTAGCKEQEAFANMYEAQFDAGKEAAMKKYFPTAYKRFCEMLAENK